MDVKSLVATRFWEEPELTRLNSLPGRATLYPYPTVEAALAGDRDGSPWRQSLNGEWDFRLAARPSAVGAAWFAGAGGPGAGDTTHAPAHSHLDG